MREDFFLYLFFSPEFYEFLRFESLTIRKEVTCKQEYVYDDDYPLLIPAFRFPDPCPMTCALDIDPIWFLGFETIIFSVNHAPRNQFLNSERKPCLPGFLAIRGILAIYI